MTLRVAIVHDWLNQYGGAERVLEVLHELFPEAPIYTSMYEPRVMPAEYRRWDIRTSFMQHLPLVKRHHQAFLPLYPLAFESLDLSEYDLVISNSSGFCHGVITRPETCHINYCLTPPRFLWLLPQYLAREQVGRLARLALLPTIGGLRQWDVLAADRVDYFVGISQSVVARIRKYYRRDADLLYPPVDAGRFEVGEGAGEYYLVVSRLVPYKRIDLAVRAFNQLGLPLVVVGGGRDLKPLRRIAGPTVKFLGRLPEGQLPGVVARCRALIFPGEEDFGITPLEAQASGRPVVAFAAGGALETVESGKTGEFFDEPTPESLADAVRRVDGRTWNTTAIRAHAEGFDVERFRARFWRLVKAKLAEHRLSYGPQ